VPYPAPASPPPSAPPPSAPPPSALPPSTLPPPPSTPTSEETALRAELEAVQKANEQKEKEQALAKEQAIAKEQAGGSAATAEMARLRQMLAQEQAKSAALEASAAKSSNLAPPDQWPCTECTFLNSNTVHNCIVCDTPKNGTNPHHPTPHPHPHHHPDTSAVPPVYVVPGYVVASQPQPQQQPQQQQPQPLQVQQAAAHLTQALIHLQAALAANHTGKSCVHSLPFLSLCFLC